MRGWGWIAGALAVLVGVTLSLGLVGVPGGGGSNDAAASTRVAAARRPHARVTRADASAGATAAIRAQGGRRPAPERSARGAMPRLPGQPRPDGIGLEIERQRSAMRAALLLLVASDGTRAR